MANKNLSLRQAAELFRSQPVDEFNPRGGSEHVAVFEDGKVLVVMSSVARNGDLGKPAILLYQSVRDAENDGFAAD